MSATVFEIFFLVSKDSRNPLMDIIIVACHNVPLWVKSLLSSLISFMLEELFFLFLLIKAHFLFRWLCNIMQLSWTFEKEGTKLEWRWKCKPSANDKETTAAILDFLMDANVRLSVRLCIVMFCAR